MNNYDTEMERMTDVICLQMLNAIEILFTVEKILKEIQYKVCK